jgi:WD40 repeat protein
MWIQKVPGGGVEHIAYATDSGRIYTLDSGGDLTAWDIATRTGRRLERMPSCYYPVQGLHPLSDGRIVRLERPRLKRSTTKHAVTVLDATDGRDTGGLEWPTAHHTSAAHVTPDGRLFYLKASTDQILGWNLTTCTEEPGRTIPGPRNSVRDFDLSRDERLVAVVNKRGETTVYEWGEGPELQNPHTFPLSSGARLSPDGNTLVLFSTKPQRVALWEVPSAGPEGVAETGQPRAKNVPCRTAEGLFAFNPVLPVFAALNRDKALTLYSRDTGAAIRSLDFGVGQKVQCVCFSPDGLTCAAGGSNKRFVVFDVDL